MPRPRSSSPTRATCWRSERTSSKGQARTCSATTPYARPTSARTDRRSRCRGLLRRGLLRCGLLCRSLLHGSLLRNGTLGGGPRGRSLGRADARRSARRPRTPGEDRREEPPGVAFLDQGDLLRCPLGDHPATAVAALGTQVDNPVGVLDDVQVVLDDDDGVALVDQALEHPEQLVDVIEVEARGWLVQDVDRSSGGTLLYLGGQLDALSLTAGECGGRLAEPDVAEADVHERREMTRD